MPELPEIENLKLQLDLMLRGCQVTCIDFHRTKIRSEIDTKNVEKILAQPILQVTRRAKYFFWETTVGSVGFHLGMSGQFVLKLSNKIQAAHTHAVFTIKNRDSKEIFLHFIDPRRFGQIFSNFLKENHKFLKHLGPEPLTEGDLGNYLWRKSRRRNVPIKSFVMDQKILVGVGNIYCCEALFSAQINPRKNAAKITRSQYELLACHIQDVLKKSIQAGGTSFKDYLHINLHRGGFQNDLNVYGRAGKPCRVCGAEIKNKKIAGRSSFYCSICQK